MADGGKVMEIASVPEAIAWQADHAERAGAPSTARGIRALLAVLDTDTAVARAMANWRGLSLEDAMPLRVAGGFHWLYLSGAEPGLKAVYTGETTDQGAINALFAQLAQKHDAVLLPWLDHPPQTNEAGRSASVTAALLWLAGRVGRKFELIEIGASAGINTMMARFGFELGGVTAGPADAAIRILPEWRGPPPPAGPVEIVSARGCDIAPVDLADPAQALRLKAYIWPDATQRMARMDAAIAMAREARPDLVRADAAAFVAQCLAAPQAEEVTRVLFHTVMWQYLPVDTRAAITAAMEAAGALATADRPLAWVAVETNRETFKHECRVRFWPGGDYAMQLAEAHPHGAWVEWQA